jgi:hypothetical protein
VPTSLTVVFRTNGFLVPPAGPDQIPVVLGIIDVSRISQINLVAKGDPPTHYLVVLATIVEDGEDFGGGFGVDARFGQNTGTIPIAARRLKISALNRDVSETAGRVSVVIYAKE